MRKTVFFLFLIVVAAGIIYWQLFRPQFHGIASLGGNLFSDHCRLAETLIDNLAASNGFLIGHIRDAVYQKDRIYILLESVDGTKYSLMAIPGELSNLMAGDFHKPGLNFYQLKYFYFSFCGRQNMFSTGVVEGERRLETRYQQIQDLVNRYMESGEVVAAYFANDRNNFVFDRSGAIFVHQLHFIPTQ